MDPHRFLRILIGDLSLRSSSPLLHHRPPTTFFCTVKLPTSPPQKVTTAIPLLPLSHSSSSSSSSSGPPVAACFTLDQTAISSPPPLRLTISIYRNSHISPPCLPPPTLLFATLSLPLDLTTIPPSRKDFSFHNGWLPLTTPSNHHSPSSSADLFLRLWSEHDPRFLFHFENLPECSPQVLQVNGNIKQPVFTCKFAFRNSHLSMSSSSSSSWWGRSASWFANMGGQEKKEVQAKERKGWSVTVHDLSGSPVAAASMVTPFVPSPGCDRVGRTNPGAWLILRPDQRGWQPWGRLEAWLDCSDSVGYRFELLPDCGGGEGITLCESTINRKKGGRFTIDMTSGASPLTSPGSSFDWNGASGSSESVGGGWGGHGACPRGFVMSATVDGWRRRRMMRRRRGRGDSLEVVISAEQVTCREDAAVFVALGAAMDLSMEACRLFSVRLRKGLRPEMECFVG